MMTVTVQLVEIYNEQGTTTKAINAYFDLRKALENLEDVVFLKAYTFQFDEKELEGLDIFTEKEVAIEHKCDYICLYGDHFISIDDAMKYLIVVDFRINVV